MIGPNWVFSCRRCNRDNKMDKWPKYGYVDPAAADVRKRPERYFAYDMLTHEMIPKDGLGGDELRRAWDTINDLGLNEVDVLRYRQDWIQRFIEDIRRLRPDEIPAFIEFIESQSSEYTGATRMVVAQLREAGEIP